MFNVHLCYVTCLCLGIPPVVCAGDDPNLVKALVLRQIFSRHGSASLIVSHDSFRMAFVYVYVTFICKICLMYTLVRHE